MLLLLQVRDSDPGLHGSRLLAAAGAPANHSRSSAPARTLRQEAEILQAVLICMRCKRKDSKLLGRANENRIRAKPTPEKENPWVRDQIMGVRVEVLGSDLGVGPGRSDIDWSKSEGREVGNSDLWVRERGSGTTSQRAGGPEAGTRTYWSGLEVRRL